MHDLVVFYLKYPAGQTARHAWFR